jgi:hypothetical protein
VLRQDLQALAVDAPEIYTPAPLLDELIRKGQTLQDIGKDQG